MLMSSEGDGGAHRSKSSSASSGPASAASAAGRPMPAACAVALPSAPWPRGAPAPSAPVSKAFADASGLRYRGPRPCQVVGKCGSARQSGRWPRESGARTGGGGLRPENPAAVVRDSLATSCHGSS